MQHHHEIKFKDRIAFARTVARRFSVVNNLINPPRIGQLKVFTVALNDPKTTFPKLSETDSCQSLVNKEA